MVRVLKAHHQKRASGDKGVSLIEVGGILAILGILATVSIIAVGQLTGESELTVVRNRLSSAANVVQQIGTQRNSDGSFNFAGQTTAACKADNTGGSAGAATALQGRLTGATFNAIGDGDKIDLTLTGASAGSPETVHVWVNKEDIQLIDGITISACNMAVLIIRPTANQSFCAIIIKGSKHAGVGYDASESGSIEGEARHALCIPPTANLKADGAATGGFTKDEVAYGIAPKCWAPSKTVSAKCTTTDKGTNTITGAGGSVLSFYETSIPDAERQFPL